MKLNVHVLVTHSTPGAQAAKHATSTVPIVVAGVIDPVDLGLVASLAVYRSVDRLLDLTIVALGVKGVLVSLPVLRGSPSALSNALCGPRPRRGPFS